MASITNTTEYNKYIYSTGTHYISNSGHDENGRYSNGKAGDQSGDEWYLRSWYSRPWDCVLRYEADPRVGYLLAVLGCAAALNDLIGYDQNQRYTYWEHLYASNFDPRQITVACEDDCSAGVCANIRAVGYLLGIDKFKTIEITSTHYMRNMLRNIGFKVYTDSDYTRSTKRLWPGDVLLSDQHHVCTNVTNGGSSKFKKSSTQTTSTIITGEEVYNGLPLTTIAKYVEAEFGVAADKSYGDKGYNCLLGVAQTILDEYKEGGYGSTVSEVLKNNFTKPAETYSDRTLQAVRDVFINGKRRFSNARALQFRSFYSYGVPGDYATYDKEKCASLDKNFDYLGTDSISPTLGHHYWGKKNSSSSAAVTQTTVPKTTTGTNKGYNFADKYDQSLSGFYKCKGRLMLRQGCGTDWDVIEQMPSGSSVYCGGFYTLHPSNGSKWFYVDYNGKRGFCCSDYLNKA